MADNDELMKQALADNRDSIADFARVAAAVGWIQHLAVPDAWERLVPKITEPVQEMLLAHVEHFIAYSKSGGRYSVPDFEPAPYEDRVARAERLRALLSVWTPPVLTEAITQAARDLLHAEGHSPQVGWDAQGVV